MTKVLNYSQSLKLNIIISIKGSSETLETSRTIDIRLRAFNSILKLLNVATQLGVGPKLNDLAAKNDNDPLTTTIENDNLPSPILPLGALKKVKSKSVGVQTSISNRVTIPFNFFNIYLIYFIFYFSSSQNPTPYQLQTESSTLPSKASTLQKHGSSLVST